MNKYEALNKFYNSFGIPAYEENSVPEKKPMPYITYELITSSIESESIAMSFKIYYRSESLIEIDSITEKISKVLTGGVNLKCDEGYITLHRGEPFALNIGSGEKSVKAKYINVTANYITL